MTGVKHGNNFFFNMGVPVSGTTVVHRASSNPQPIVVEKLTGKYMTPSQSLRGSTTRVVQHERLGAGGGNRDPFCSRGTMDQAVILAQLDMKKKNRNPEYDLPSALAECGDGEKVTKSVRTKQRSQVKVHEVSNKPQRNASVQISRIPSRRKSPEPTPLSQLPVTTNSPPTHDKEPSNQEIQRLQGDITKQLTELRDLLDNLVKECNNPKSAPSEEEQEAIDTTQQEQGALRALTRQVYIVQQQVADVERNLNTMHNYKTAARVHANKLGWTKCRLTCAYRGTFKSLQGMTSHLRRFAGSAADPVFQLRLGDLLTQLLQSVRILLDLYLQLTSIFSKNINSTCPELLELVDITDALQAEWQTQLEHKMKELMSNGVQGGSTSPHLSKKNLNNKPIQKNFRRQLSLDITPERKSILRKSSDLSNPSRAVRKMPKKLPNTKKPTKSVIFPAHIQVHRKPYEAFSNQTTYAQPTLSSRMKSLSELQQEEKSEPQELWQSFPTITENREEEEELPGFGGQPLASRQADKMEKIGASIIEELLALDSKQQERQEVKLSSASVKDTEESKSPEGKSMADVHFTDDGLRSIDLNLPPLEVLLHRLGEMEKEQIQIRSRWASTRYHDTEAAAAEQGLKAKGSVPTTNHQPRPPSPIFFSKKAGTSQAFEIFQEQTQKFPTGEFPGAIRFTKKVSNVKGCQQIQKEESEQESVDQIRNRRIQFECPSQVQRTTTNLDCQGSGKPKRLFLSNKILKNITQNRQRFSNYLRNSAYHQVESFDPWRLTEELADSILADCIEEVSEEMQDLSHDLVHHLFDNEFTQLPPPPPPTRRAQDTSEYPPMSALSLAS